jgi:hypothetical protein
MESPLMRERSEAATGKSIVEEISRTEVNVRAMVIRDRE